MMIEQGSFVRWRFRCGVHLKLRTFVGDALARPLDRDVSRLDRVQPDALRFGPANGVADHALHWWMVIDRVQLVAGAEVENLPVAPTPAAAAAEYFAPLEPRDEHLFLGRGHIERLAVHLGVGNLDAGVDAFSNGMAGIGDPDAFSLAGFPPVEKAGC